MRLKAPTALLFFLFSCVFAPLASYAQETEPPEGARISSVQVSGFDIHKLSPGLQEEITKLAGTSLSRQQLRDLAARLEAEQPRYVTAIRTSQASDGTAQVTFVVARLRVEEREENINAKYKVDKVEVRGVPERDLSSELRSELDALSGKPLDNESAEQLAGKLRAAFPGYDVERRVVRAEKQGALTVIYTLRRPEWARFLRYEPIDATALYHSDQGWGAVLPLIISGGDFHVMPIITWSDADNYLEENSGFGIRVESRHLGTERLGMMLDWSALDVDWRGQTLAALPVNPQLAGLYRNRMSVTPLLKFAFTPQISVAGGVGITELDAFDEASGLPSQMANAAIGSVRYKQRWKSSSSLEHQAGAVLTLRKGASGLESDFVYDRYLGEAEYLFKSGKHEVFVSGMAGRISGDAPLFERFSLGSSRTLRGWNKYDISPAGGDRMFHTSLEYHFSDVMLFVDAGSVWNTGTAKRIRFSTGAGYSPGPLFFTVGFPINTDEFRAVFTAGFRFGLSSTGVTKF